MKSLPRTKAFQGIKKTRSEVMYESRLKRAALGLGKGQYASKRSEVLAEKRLARKGK